MSGNTCGRIQRRPVFGGERWRIYVVILTKDTIRSSTEIMGVGKF